VVEVAPGESVLAAEKSAAYTARDAVVGAGFDGIDEKGTRVAHKAILRPSCQQRDQVNAGCSIGDSLDDGCPRLVRLSRVNRRLSRRATVTRRTQNTQIKQIVVGRVAVDVV
jgi:hypothetical protein